ncbi:MAG: hypothetical protein K2X50_05465 [Gammaproteobacteria bacterium]|nr:hypothetical protein [Gammaproteobacteria bacterium]
MSNKKQGELTVFRQNPSATIPMETVVALAQQRQSALGRRLNDNDSIQSQLDQWAKENALEPSQNTILK